MVAAAPAPFVVSGDVAAIGSATESLGRREPHDFVKRAFPVRRATVLARGQKNANANAEEGAVAAEEEAQQQQDNAAAGADEQQAKGKGKGKGKQEAQAGKLAEPSVVPVS